MKLIILIFTYVFLITTLKVDFLGMVDGLSSSFDYFFNMFPNLDGISVSFVYMVRIFKTPMMMLVLSFFAIYFVVRITVG